VTVVLHTLNAAPSSAAFKDCLKVVQAGDAIVLMGDGVYVALAGTEACSALQTKGAELFILSTHALLAGVTHPAQGISSIDIEGLVVLTERYPRQLAWY
jgi:tRNA 2-thiouridine synthesizing protein B|tara:strand:- start:4533 stop:4829 length:297 start_codon:yes stop_codon:yes gene_type:complete